MGDIQSAKGRSIGSVLHRTTRSGFSDVDIEGLGYRSPEHKP